MYNAQIINNTEKFVKSILEKDSSGHDWWHIYRVHNLAKKIAKKEEANLYVVELTALLHDIADWKFNDGDLDIGPNKARQWLSDQEVSPDVIDSVAEIIKKMSFKGANVQDLPLSLEGKIVQDADRLDAIGAIGIARAFACGGYMQQPLHLPDLEPVFHKSFEEYKNKNTTAINHFYEKLLLLKDRLNTKTAREIANTRHTFMQNYLDQFFNEWNSVS